MLPLPVGTERVRRHTFDDGYTIGAFPSHKIWWDIPLEWSVTAQIAEEDCPVWEAAEVYHVPQPAPADKPTILPPAEMPEALRPYWTPESRVYKSSYGTYRLVPQGKALDDGVKLWNHMETAASCEKSGDTLLPNRTVTTESILGTASAAKAVEQGVADVLEGRTRQVDSLDQLAAEAQAEGEYGTAWERFWGQVGEKPPVYRDGGAYQRRFIAFVEAERKSAVETWNRAVFPITVTHPSGDLSIKVAIEDGNRVVVKTDEKPRPVVAESCKHPILQYEHHTNRNRCLKCGLLCDVVVPLEPNRTAYSDLVKGLADHLTPPTPRRTAREVAEEVAWQQGTDLVCYKIVNGKWGPVDEDRTQTAIREAMLKVAQAAIERDREGR